MIDPGAFGTLLIRRNAERADAEADARAVHRLTVRAPERRERAGIRVMLARGLRRAAERLDQPVVRDTVDPAW